MPGDLLVPSSVAAEEQARQINAEVDAQVEEAKILGLDLKRIDPTLSVVWVPEGADDPEVVPARWHIRKRIAGSIDAYIPIVGPEGEYREPGAWVLDWLQAADLWNPQVHRSRQEAKERHREAKTRAKQREEEQRRDEMALAARAAKRIRGDAGMKERTDLKQDKATKGAREAKKQELILP